MINPTTGLEFLFNSSCRLSDIRAMLDSYGVEVWNQGLLYRRAPLHSFPLGGGEPTVLPWEKCLFPIIDTTVDVRLCRYEPPSEGDFLTGIRERCTRWPFYVEEPLEIMFRMGDQWWKYKFTPGKTYEERRID